MNFQIPRQTWLYLLASLSFILIPHISRSLIVLPVVWLLASFWQVMVYRQKWKYPNALFKLFIIGGGLYCDLVSIPLCIKFGICYTNLDYGSSS